MGLTYDEDECADTFARLDIQFRHGRDGLQVLLVSNLWLGSRFRARIKRSSSRHPRSDRVSDQYDPLCIIPVSTIRTRSPLALTAQEFQRGKHVEDVCGMQDRRWGRGCGTCGETVVDQCDGWEGRGGR